MKKTFMHITIAFLICGLAFSLAFLTGCGKKQDAGTMAPATSPGLPGQGVPGAPGTPMQGQGMPSAPGAPGAPGAQTTAAPGTTTQPTANSKTLEFNQLKLASPVQTVMLKEEGISIEFLRFKYTDWQGKVWLCEMPSSEAKVARSESAWIAAFDVYKKESTTTKTTEKKSVKRLNDFPFVSPPPAEKQQQPGTQGSGTSNQLPGRLPGPSRYPTGP